jgi:hypothetical protein
MKLENMTRKQLLEHIEELSKECNALWSITDCWTMCRDDYTMHDQYENLDDKYAYDDFNGVIILKELYDYTEEDGYQLKEIEVEE